MFPRWSDPGNCAGLACQSGPSVRAAAPGAARPQSHAPSRVPKVSLRLFSGHRGMSVAAASVLRAGDEARLSVLTRSSTVEAGKRYEARGYRVAGRPAPLRAAGDGGRDRGGDGDAQSATGVTRGDPLVGAAAGRSPRDFVRAGGPDLAGLESGAVAAGDVQVLHRPAVGGQDPRRHRPVLEAAAERGGPVHRRKSQIQTGRQGLPAQAAARRLRRRRRSQAPGRDGVARAEQASHTAFDPDLRVVVEPRDAIFIRIITRQAIRRGGFDSVEELTAAIERSIDAWNDRCEPFVSTKPYRRTVKQRQSRDTTPAHKAAARLCRQGQNPMTSRNSRTVPRPGWGSALRMSRRLTALGCP